MTTVPCSINGEQVEVPAGRTVAAAMILDRSAHGSPTHSDASQSDGVASAHELRRTRTQNAPRGVFCGIGVCFDCLVYVNGQGPLRSCLVEVEPGMEITSCRPPAPAKDAPAQGGERDA